jgi:hypothetical protein
MLILDNFHAHRGRFLALCTTLGLALSCLNPDISDEAPISETTAALEGADAGAEFELPSDTPGDDTPTNDAADTPPSEQPSQPTKARRERGRRNPFGR